MMVVGVVAIMVMEVVFVMVAVVETASITFSKATKSTIKTKVKMNT